MSNEMIFQVPSTLQDVRFTRHRAAILKAETQEELSDVQVGRLASLVGKEGWWTFSVEQVSPEDLISLPKMPKLDGKTPAQRLRSVIFIKAQQEGVLQAQFEEYYAKQMEYLIEMMKADLDGYDPNEKVPTGSGS